MAVAQGDIAVVSGDPGGEGDTSGGKAAFLYVVAAADANNDVTVYDPLTGRQFLVNSASIIAKVTPVAP